MNTGSPPSSRLTAVSPQSEHQRQVARWRDLLFRCVRKPSRKRIHALRCHTLRLRVAVEHWLREMDSDPAAARAYRRWNNEGKKLRRVLQPIRDADVYLPRLDMLRDTLEGTPEGKSQLGPLCLREVDTLEKRLKQQRQAGIAKFAQVIGEREKRLRRLSKEMEAVLAPGMPSRAASTAKAALQIFIEVAGEFPEIDSTNLHDYRKRIKPALYLAEISAAADPRAGKLADGLRKLHEATGDWHDWHVLALEAGRVLPSHRGQNGLVAVLEKKAEESLQRALDLCQRSANQLLEDAGENRSFQQRKPVAADPGYRQLNEYRSLRNFG